MTSAQILAVVIGALIVAGLAVLVAWLYRDKPMQLTPCGSCRQDCPSKEMSPKEQQKYYERELTAKTSACRTVEKSNVSGKH